MQEKWLPGLPLVPRTTARPPRAMGPTLPIPTPRPPRGCPTAGPSTTTTTTHPTPSACTTSRGPQSPHPRLMAETRWGSKFPTPLTRILVWTTPPRPRWPCRTRWPSNNTRSPRSPPVCPSTLIPSPLTTRVRSWGTPTGIPTRGGRTMGPYPPSSPHPPLGGESNKTWARLPLPPTPRIWRVT